MKKLKNKFGAFCFNPQYVTHLRSDLKKIEALKRTSETLYLHVKNENNFSKLAKKNMKRYNIFAFIPLM